MRGEDARLVIPVEVEEFPHDGVWLEGEGPQQVPEATHDAHSETHHKHGDRDGEESVGQRGRDFLHEG